MVIVRVNWQRLICLFSGGCKESPEELSVNTADNMVSLYCERCGSFVRDTPMHDITNPEVLKTIEHLMEEDDDE